MDLSVSRANNLVSSSARNPAGWSFGSCLFSKAAIVAKIDRDFQNMLRSPKKGLSFENNGDGRSLKIAFVVCDKIFKSLARILCPIKLVVFENKRHFLCVRVTLASLSSMRTIQTITNCFFGGF